MKHFVFIGIFIFIFSPIVKAEKMYISDIIKITLRTGPGIDHKIITMVSSGQEVEVLIPNEKWTNVRTIDGKEGWVLNRFLTPKKPSSLLLERLEKKHKKLTDYSESLLKENKKLKDEYKRLNSGLSSSKTALKKLSESYEALKRESSGFIKLKTNYQKTMSRLSEQTKKADKFEEELIQLQIGHNIRWFLAGAGVLILGFLIGFSAKRQKRRSSLL